MSLMDDVFDVRAALEGKPEAKSFESIEEQLWAYEEWIDVHRPQLQTIADFKALLTTEKES